MKPIKKFNSRTIQLLGILALCIGMIGIIPTQADPGSPNLPAENSLIFIPIIQSAGDTLPQPTPTPDPTPIPTPPPGSNYDWPMLGANPQRTSWSPEEVRGALSVEWFVTINARMAREPQVIAAYDRIFVSTTEGLFAFNADSGAPLWVYGTEMPLGHSPTYSNGTVYVGSYDRRIHAVNAFDGKLKTGWTFVEAGAGFETNPLVIDNRVYIGNRDGYFYCLDATTGDLVWKWRDEADEHPEAPIRFSAAYKDGVIYFGKDNSHAYAIRDDGNSASLVWKSALMPGVGFTSYWPVLYHDQSSDKDYVLFSGSKKDASFGWFSDPYNPSFYYQENYDLFSGIPLGGLIGPSGNEPGDWAAGTVTIDASKIQDYFNNKPQKRHLFILDAATGLEYTPYAPVTWVSTTHGGDKRPPVIGGDGVIYTHIGYKNGDPTIPPNMGASGGVSGWKFGTQYISRVYDFERGYADETVKFTAGGNLIYWSEGFNMPYGAFDITQPFGTNDTWLYTYCGGCLGIPNNGGDTEFVPYKQRLYMLDGNVLAALSITGGLTDLGVVYPTTPTTPPSSPISSQEINQLLENEVTKIIEAGLLRPGFHESGIWSAAVNGFFDSSIIAGNHLSEYFHNPGDTIYTLYRAYPYLSPDLQAQVISYVKNYFGIGKVADITHYAHIGWKNGAQREIFEDTPELLGLMERNYDDQDSVIASLPRTYYHYLPQQGQINIWDFPQDSFYGAWKYAQLVPAEAKTVFDAMKSKLETTPLSDDDLLRYPYVLNQYIVGYRGYLELEKMAGYTSDISQSNKYPEYIRLMNLRMNNFSQDYDFPGLDYNNNLSVARNFMYLVPELADEFASRLPTQVQTAINDYTSRRPYWFVTKYDNTYAEGVFEPLHTYHALFQARALILNEPYEQLARFIDVPAFWRGDLYYIQNLVAALDAAP